MKPLLPFLLLVAACGPSRETREAGAFALVEDGQRREVPRPDLDVEVVETELPADDDAYLLGARDVVDVQVEGQPEFSVRSRALDDRLVGFRIQKDGRVYLPLIGAVEAAGKSVLELRTAIAARLEDLVENPRVTVDVIAYESQKFYVLGAVERPGVFAADGDARLLDGIGRAGGIRDGGDIEGAYVIRGRALLPVSLGDILLRGDTSRNVRMRGGDLVYVPPAVRWQVYVLGEVRKPGVVPMPQTGLTLAAALAGAQGLDPLHAEKTEVRVFRGSWQSPQVFTLGLEEVLRYGDAIELKPGDRIHVAPRALAKWSRTLQLLAPFLNTTLPLVALSD